MFTISENRAGKRGKENAHIYEICNIYVFLLPSKGKHPRQNDLHTRLISLEFNAFSSSYQRISICGTTQSLNTLILYLVYVNLLLFTLILIFNRYMDNKRIYIQCTIAGIIKSKCTVQFYTAFLFYYYFILNIHVNITNYGLVL